MSDGIITLENGAEYGFTPDKFMSHSYLWKTGNEVWVSAIQSVEEGKGYLSGLFDKILQLGFDIVVPTPLGKMPAILKHKGFTESSREFMPGEEGEVWTKKAKHISTGEEGLVKLPASG